MPRAKRTPAPATAVTRFNALRHGLTSDAPVIPGVESYEEWEAHREAIVADLNLDGAMQLALGDRIARLLWRLRRVDRYECTTIDVSRGRVEFDFAQIQNSTNEPPSVEEAELRQEDARRCLAIIDTLLDTPPATPLAIVDVEAMLEELADSIDKTSEDYLAGIEEFEREGDWTVGRLIAVFEALSARDNYAFTDMLKQTAGRARVIVAGYQLTIARTRAEVDRMYEERLLPDAPTLDRIIRYEASLNRMLYQALNQLEATQSRRAGAPTSLHRVQAFGLLGG